MERDIPSEILALLRVRDRLRSTTSQQLPDILRLLLPRFLPLADDQLLTETVETVGSDILRKIKSSIDSYDQISDAVNAKNLFASLCVDLFSIIKGDALKNSEALTFSILDCVFTRYDSAESKSLCITNPIQESVRVTLFFAMQTALDKIAIFNAKSNNLCSYFLCLLDQSQKFFRYSERCGDLIADFLLDICCLSQPFERAAIGSVQPGLSVERVDRLTAIQQKWTLAQLREIKEIILRNILTEQDVVDEKSLEEETTNIHKIPTKYCVAMAIILSQDNDNGISTQAVFKMNGAAHLFKAHDYLSEKANPTDTAQFLITLFTKSEKRTPFRSVVQIALIRWLCKEMKMYFEPMARSFVPSLVQNILSSSGSLISPSNIGLLAAFMHLMETLMSCLKDASYQDLCILIVQVSKKLLLHFASINSSTASQSSDYNSELNMNIRCNCYAIVEIAVVRATDAMIQDVELVVLLFRLLGLEDERIITKLHIALDALQQAYIKSGNQFAGDNKTIVDLILQARQSTDAKKKQISLQWSIVLFGWTTVTIDTAIILSGDSNPTVRESVHKVFDVVKTNMNSTISAPESVVSLLTLFMQGCIAHKDVFISTAFQVSTVKLLLEAILLGLHRLLNSNPKETDTFGLYIAGKLDSCLTVINGKTPIRLETDFQEHLLKFLAIISATCVEQSSDKTIDSGGIDNYFNCHIPDLNGSMKAAENEDPISPSVSHFRVDIIRLLASVAKNCLYLLHCSSPLVSTSAGIRTVRAPITAALLSWLSVSEMAVKNDIANSLCILCLQGDEVDDSANLDYWTNLVRTLTHKAGLRGGSFLPIDSLPHDSISSREGSAKERLLNRDVALACGALKCLQSIVVVELYDISTRTDQQEQRWKVLSVEAARLYNQIVSFPLFKISYTSDTPLSASDIALWITNGMDCLDILTSTGCLNLKTFSEDQSNAAGLLNEFLSLSSTDLKWIPQLRRISCDLRLKIGDLFPFQSTVEKLLSFLSNGDSRVKSKSFESISRLALFDDEIANRLLTQWLKSDSLSMDDTRTRFAYSESLIRLCLSQSTGIGNAFKPALQFLLDMNHSQSRDSESHGTPPVNQSNLSSQRCTMSVILLVLVRFIRSAAFDLSSKFHAEENRYFAVLSPDEYKLILTLLLQLLREKNPLTQDMCSIAICHLYDAAVLMDANSISRCYSLSDYISDEVTTILSREKKLSQPAGYAVAGAAASNTRPNMTPESNQQAQQQQQQQQQQQAPPEIAVPVNRNDPLALATTAAASEVAAAVQALAAANLQSPTDEALDLGDYGIYGVVSKISRKMGEKAIIFGLLALIRSDPSFGVGSTERLFDQYRVPDIEIEEHKLVKVIPMLYALRFEPNPTVRELMRTLWSKLFRSSTLKAVVNAHLEEIIKYLCSKMCSPIWRDRDSSCLALESLIPQRSWSVLKKYMSELWYNGLRVLDDVRISTRMAALDLMKALSAMVVHCSNPNESEISVVREVVDFIIPMLLDKGLVNPSAEARGFCLGVLLKIVQVNVDSTAPQSSNPLFDRQQAPVRSTQVSQARYRLYEEPLDRWLPPVIAVLVESMSALEPRVLQYMQFHTSRMQLSDEELEQARIKMAQSSPMQEALNCCLKRLTTPVIPDVVRVLSQHLKIGVGLSTRAAAAEAMSFLAEKYPHDLGNYANVCLESVIETLLNSPQLTSTLKKAMVSALAALSKVVDKETLGRHCDALVYKYNHEQQTIEHVETSKTIASCIDVIVSRSGDQITDSQVWKRLLVCIYAGCFEADAECSKLWLKVWNESAIFASGFGTTQSCLARVLPELCAVIYDYLRDLFWNRRLQGLNILSDIIVTLDPKQFSPHLNLVLFTALRQLPGQIWTGKGKLLTALAEVCAKCDKNMMIPSMAEDMDVLLRSRSTEGGDPSCDMDRSMLTLTVSELQQVAAQEKAKDRARTAAVAFSPEDYEKVESLKALQEAEEAFLQKVRDTASTGAIRWEINIIAFCSLLIRESYRGDKDYQYAAAQALSSLPWSVISKHAARQFMENILPQLCERICVRINNIADNTYSAFLAGKEVSQQQQPLVAPQKVAALPVVVPKAVNTRTMNTSAMFGVRYGAVPPPAKQRKPTPTVSRPVQSTSTAQGNPPSETSSIPAPGSVDNVNDMEVVEQKSSASNEVGVVVMEEYVEFIEKSDAAFRMVIIECICKGWPIAQESSENIARFMVEIISWIIIIMEREIWSVKKAAVQLAGVIGSEYPLAADDAAPLDFSQRHVYKSRRDRLLHILRRGLDEQKYSQVRVESLKSLEKILKGVNGQFFTASEDSKAVIRGLIRAASQDSQPTILEAAARLQDSWMQLK